MISRQSYNDGAIYSTAAEITAALPDAPITREIKLRDHVAGKVSAKISNITGYGESDKIRVPSPLLGVPLLATTLQAGGEELVDRVAADIVKFICEFDDSIERPDFEHFDFKKFDVKRWNDKQPIIENLNLLEQHPAIQENPKWQSMIHALRENTGHREYGRSIIGDEEMMPATMKIEPFGISITAPVFAPPEYILRKLHSFPLELADKIWEKYDAARPFQPLSRHALCEALAADMGSLMSVDMGHGMKGNHLDTATVKRGMGLLEKKWPDTSLPLRAVPEKPAQVMPARRAANAFHYV